MQLIDTHVHFWDLCSRKNAWLLGHNHDSGFLGNYDAICRDFLPQDLTAQSKQHSIAGAVHVQAGWERPDTTGEAAWIESLNKTSLYPIACIAYANLTQPNLHKHIQAHLQYDCFRGFRQTLNWHRNPDLSDAEQDVANLPAFQQGLKALNQHALIFELQAYPTQLQTLLPIIADCDKTTFVIEHCALPIFTSAKDQSLWENMLTELAQLQHVTLKISGLDLCMRHNPTHIQKHQLLDTIFKIFPIEQIVFGSNYPVESLYQRYDQIIQTILDLGLTTEMQQALFIDNAKRVYRL